MSDHIKAFIAAQAEMGKALKDTENPHFRSKYADLTSVQSACFPALNKHGFAVMQPNGTDEHGEFVETVFLHETGERFSTRIYLRIGKGDMQGYGSAITYARRYGLMNLAGIAPEDDDGNAAAKNPPKDEQKRKPAPIHGLDAQTAITALMASKTLAELQTTWGKIYRDAPDIAKIGEVEAAKDIRKKQLAGDDDPFGLPPVDDFPGDRVKA